MGHSSRWTTERVGRTRWSHTATGSSVAPMPSVARGTVGSYRSRSKVVGVHRGGRRSRTWSRSGRTACWWRKPRARLRRTGCSATRMAENFASTGVRINGSVCSVCEERSRSRTTVAPDPRRDGVRGAATGTPATFAPRDSEGEPRSGTGGRRAVGRASSDRKLRAPQCGKRPRVVRGPVGPRSCLRRALLRRRRER